MKILIVAENASARFGGEAALPLHYFRVLRQREHDVWLLTHSRVRDELTTLFPSDIGRRILFVDDSWLHKAMWRVGQWLPARLAYLTTGYVSRLSTQWSQRKIARRIVTTEGIDIVHQPVPVSPKEPSLLYRLKAPVVIGPMNGGMNYPPGFRENTRHSESALVTAGRALSNLLNRLVPGKRQAACLLVANDRSKHALPDCLRGRVEILPENGVDLSLWRASPPRSRQRGDGCVRLVFMGRLVNWKALDLLIDAFLKARVAHAISLLVIGDGPEGARWRLQCERADALASHEHMPGRVFFAGWLTQAQAATTLATQDVLVLPSLLECGGAVVLEAMALGLPVIATDWGGPADYLDARCGILVAPTSRAQFVQSLAEAIGALAADAALRTTMGSAGRRRVEEHFDWERKVDRMLGIYRSAADAGRNSNADCA